VIHPSVKILRTRRCERTPERALTNRPKGPKPFVRSSFVLRNWLVASGHHIPHLTYFTDPCLDRKVAPYVPPLQTKLKELYPVGE
jgi:hypothetical protein